MKSIFVRILTGFVAVSFVLIAAMSVIFTVAVSRSINEWNAGKRNDFVALILPQSQRHTDLKEAFLHLLLKTR